jgi:hypothetical protein
MPRRRGREITRRRRPLPQAAGGDVRSSSSSRERTSGRGALVVEVAGISASGSSSTGGIPSGSYPGAEALDRRAGEAVVLAGPPGLSARGRASVLVRRSRAKPRLGRSTPGAREDGGSASRVERQRGRSIGRGDAELRHALVGQRQRGNAVACLFHRQDRSRERERAGNGAVASMSIAEPGACLALLEEGGDDLDHLYHRLDAVLGDRAPVRVCDHDEEVLVAVAVEIGRDRGAGDAGRSRLTRGLLAGAAPAVSALGALGGASRGNPAWLLIHGPLAHPRVPVPPASEGVPCRLTANSAPTSVRILPESAREIPTPERPSCALAVPLRVPGSEARDRPGDMRKWRSPSRLEAIPFTTKPQEVAMRRKQIESPRTFAAGDQQVELDFVRDSRRASPARSAEWVSSRCSSGFDDTRTGFPRPS